jgi:hypothetical protein
MQLLPRAAEFSVRSPEQSHNPGQKCNDDPERDGGVQSALNRKNFGIRCGLRRTFWIPSRVPVASTLQLEGESCSALRAAAEAPELRIEWACVQ